MVSKEVSQLVVSSEQMRLDLEMVGADIWGTKAHVCMLIKTGIVSKERGVAILQALLAIERSYESGEFEIDPTRGAQLTLEQEIVSLAGETAGLSTHTARSRNDQVMVTELIFLREKTLRLAESIEQAIADLLSLAAQHVSTVMPGYTHMQPGKPTTFAHWCLLYSGGLDRMLSALYDLLTRYDRSPLGSVESFGTSWPIDREYTAELLGFSQVWDLPLDAISHRGSFQYELLHNLSLGGMTLSRFATDLLQYSTFEFGLVSFGDEIAERLHPITGSSVMAQKKNPDALELLRATGNQLGALQSGGFELLSGLPAGYNRDSRELKEYVSLGLRKFSSGITVLSKVVNTLVVHSERMEELVRANFSLTTDLADFISQKTEHPYRLVYKIVGRAVDELMNEGGALEEISLEKLQVIAQEFGVELNISGEEIRHVLTPIEALSRRSHTGGTAPDATKAVIDKKMKSIANHRARGESFRERIELARKRTAREIETLINTVTE